MYPEPLKVRRLTVYIDGVLLAAPCLLRLRLTVARGPRRGLDASRGLVLLTQQVTRRAAA